MNLYFFSYLPILALFYWISCYRAEYLLYFVFLGIPMMEWIFPLSPSIYLKPRKKEKSDDLALTLWYPIQILLFLTFLSFHSFHSFHSLSHLPKIQRFVTDAVVMGLVMSLGINVAHELIHKTEKGNGKKKWFGKRLLEMSYYGGWEWQHLLFHHKNVGLPHDPATAPLGMTVYEFVPRSIRGTLLQAFHHDPFQWIQSMSYSLAFTGIVVRVMGMRAGLFHMTSAAISVVFLEMINYLEHYGLKRNNEEEYVKEHHSWDAPFVWSSLFLFKLPLHSDHHLHAWKPFSALNVREHSPKMPCSYPVMLLASLCPPLFFRMVHPQIQG